MRPLGYISMLACLLTACAPGRLPDVRAVPVAEAFQTPADPSDNLDSAALWFGPNGQHWLLATAKATDRIVLYDATDGRVLGEVSGARTADGRLDRPNGIAVVDSLLLVVENRARGEGLICVQVLGLPSFAPVGAIGCGTFGRPYGLSVVPLGSRRYRLYVTDQGGEVGDRVRVFTFSVAGGQLSSMFEQAFGGEEGGGILQVVESLLADPVQGRLLIAEEGLQPLWSPHVKAYTLGGMYVGTALEERFFPNEAEGLALYACAEGEGYVVATDQAPQRSTFHVFDRASLRHLGSFYGPRTTNTDGVALTERAFGPFSAGAFFAVDDDQRVSAFDWAAIAQALGLRACDPL